jgi:putative DNA methylase
MNEDKRLIEDYLPIVAISAEASREKSVRKGHISTLHLWWARRPLVACRAAVYGALVPASQFVPNGGTDAQKKSLGRANAAKFITSLCQYPGSPQIIKEAQHHILTAHAERLSQETGNAVSVEDIVAGRAPRPRVLDMFAGGGAIPLEALRLGCEAYALDLNPVAHIIQLCTLVYPQKFGKSDSNERGMTGAKNEKGETTWGGLADEVRYWGNWVLEKVRAEIGDLYPLIPDPHHKGNKQTIQADYLTNHATDEVRPGYLMPVAYLWTRTVTCKNPNCNATVPLLKQTWLCKKDNRYVALKMIAPSGKRQVRFEVVEAQSENGLGFDPAGFSKGGNATCPFCGTVADSDYVKNEGCAGRMKEQMMAMVCTHTERQGRTYLAADDFPDFLPDEKDIRRKIAKLCNETGLTVPNEPIINDAKSALFPILYGFKTWGDVFTPRQMLCLLNFASALRGAHQHIIKAGQKAEPALAALSHLAIYVDRGADHWSSLCAWNPTGEKLQHTYGRGALPMVWDFSEANPFGGSVGDWTAIVLNAENGIEAGVASGPRPADVRRGSAANLPWPDGHMDAVITDPPYYDNVPYADISDFFYVWLKRTVGTSYHEHFATEGTPKKSEIVADAVRHGGDKQRAEKAYEEMMGKSFSEANRVLRPGGHLTVVYAHKTTLGWATLVDALRTAGFVVTEAWPLDTEMRTRLRGMQSAALASSIFLVARKRDGAAVGNFEEAVKPELEQIVRERVETLWAMGISGADLVIASVGAGLRAFTRFARVEYANGEEVPAERFLTEVETVVLETILSRLSKEVGGKGGQYSLASLDTASRFYVLWRYTYGAAELDAGEAIIFANGTHVELDGQHGLTTGSGALVEKKKGKYRLRDFNDRGEDKAIGLPTASGQPAPLVDMLHRTLWLMEKRPTELPQFLRDAQPNREALRLVAQALAGPALKGGEMGDVSPTAELSALTKLTANWQSVVEDSAQTTGEREEKKIGQRQLKV